MPDQSLVSTALSAVLLLALLFVPVLIACAPEIRAALSEFWRELH